MTTTTPHESIPPEVYALRRVVCACVVATPPNEPSYFFVRTSPRSRFPFFPLVATLSRFATEEGEGRERRVVVVVVVAAFAVVLRWMGCVVLTDAFAVGSGRALY